MNHKHAALALLLTLPSAQTMAQPLTALSYANTTSAQQHWQPVSGSLPVRVEKSDDGNTCMAFDAQFTKARDRACWDCTVPIDLSKFGRVSFDIKASNDGLGRNIGIYFGTPNGWYMKFWRCGASDSWTPLSFQLNTFGTEGKPDGWSKITRFRFSIWSTGAGKTAYRLRNFRAHQEDTNENLIINGSFEIPGSGIPYGWGSGHWGVRDLPWAADMNLWRKHWHLDSHVAKHGTTSLCIENTQDRPLLKARSVWITIPKTIKTCTLSAWLKSNRTALDVRLQCAGQKTNVTISNTWQHVALTHIPKKKRSTVVIAPQAPGKLWIDAVHLQAGEQTATTFQPAFRDTFIAAREALIDWSPPRRDAATAAGRSVSGPVTKATAGIDRHGRFLLDGKPYIQHSLGLEAVTHLDILNSTAQSGFKDVCVQVHKPITTTQLTAIFDRCAQVGLRIIPWLDWRMSRKRFSEHISALKNHPALLCWYVYDEPSGKRFAEADARVKLAKSLDPAHPAFINYLASRLTDHTGDIYSTDVYPIPHSAPNTAINAVKHMTDAAAKENKPVWMWLQGTGYAYGMGREPSPRELSYMAYGSLIAGARGFYYFAHFPRTAQCFNEMRALCVEIDKLAPALYSLDPAPPVTCTNPNILAKAYTANHVTCILAVNTRPTSCDVGFEVPASNGKASVLFETRSVTINQSTWKDHFGPYERHVYRLPHAHAPTSK